VWPRGKAFGC